MLSQSLKNREQQMSYEMNDLCKDIESNLRVIMKSGFTKSSSQLTDDFVLNCEENTFVKNTGLSFAFGSSLFQTRGDILIGFYAKKNVIIKLFYDNTFVSVKVIKTKQTDFVYAFRLYENLIVFMPIKTTTSIMSIDIEEAKPSTNTVKNHTVVAVTSQILNKSLKQQLYNFNNYFIYEKKFCAFMREHVIGYNVNEKFRYLPYQQLLQSDYSVIEIPVMKVIRIECENLLMFHKGLTQWHQVFSQQELIHAMIRFMA